MSVSVKFGLEHSAAFDSSYMYAPGPFCQEIKFPPHLCELPYLSACALGCSDTNSGTMNTVYLMEQIYY